MSAPKIRERDIEKQCTDILVLDGWRALKTDPVSNRGWGKGFGELGMADYLYLRYQERFRMPYSGPGQLARADCLVPAEVMWIEWKTRTGKAETHQIAWHTAERARGALVLLAGVDFPASFEGFCRWYHKSGLLHRTGLV